MAMMQTSVVILRTSTYWKSVI